MKKSELRKIIAEYNDIKIKLQKTQNKKLQEKIKEIEHRYFHETGRVLLSDLKEQNNLNKWIKLKFNPTQYKKRNITIWNEIAPRYHKRWASVNQGPFQSTDKLVKQLDIQRGDNVFDLACGTGVVTKKLLQKVGKSGNIIGGDTSVMAIKIAKRWNIKLNNLDFVNVDAENFYFSKKFDVITCQYGLFFFPNAQKALKNMKKHLKNEGKLGITVHGHPKRVPFFTSIFDAVTDFIPDYVPPGSPDLDRFGTKSALKTEVKKAGFSKITVTDFVFNFSPGTFDEYWKNYLKYVAKPLKEKLDSLDKKQRIELKQRVRNNVKPFTLKNKNIKFPWEVLILTAKNRNWLKMVRDSKKKEEKPKESPFKKFLKKRAPVYLAVIALLIVFVVPELTKGDLKDKFPENLTDEDQLVLDSLMSYNGPDREGYTLYEALSNKISEEYPNEKIYDNKKTNVNVSISKLEDQNYQVLFNFESYKGSTQYDWNIDLQTGNVIGNNQDSKSLKNLVDFYD